jgi:M-phase inducer tyrosine phosphatase
MKKSGTDYFNMNPLRASSPTASLAADLSQNFHIDQRFVSGSAGRESFKAY